MKEYIVIVFLMVGFCFAQTFDDLTEEQKLIYNRNKLSIEVVTKTEGGAFGSSQGNIASGSYSSKSWNQWIAYKGLGMKISETEFLNITGYTDEGKKAKERYESLRSKGCFFLSGCLLSLPAFLVGNADVGNDSDETIANIFIPMSVVLAIGGLTGSITYSTASRKNYTPYSSVIEIMENYNKNLIKDIINNRF